MQNKIIIFNCAIASKWGGGKSLIYNAIKFIFIIASVIIYMVIQIKRVFCNFLRLKVFAVKSILLDILDQLD